MISEPTITFTRWDPWCMRDSTSSDDPFDPPQDFDISGLYLLAHFRNKRQRENNKDSQLHLNPNVVYIGKSKRITRRLEDSRHEKVTHEYKRLFNDPMLRYLYYSIWYADWTTFDFAKGTLAKALNACLIYLERKLIWEYVKVYDTIPILNKE